MSGLDLERAIVAMINVGMAERALDLAIDYAKTCQQFGKTIGEFQLVQGKLAEMYVHRRGHEGALLPHARPVQRSRPRAMAGAARCTR